jgi:L-iditol 2-dehydrogenase
VEGVLDDGARVTLAHRVPCGGCERCLAGHETTCVQFATLRVNPGGFAERLRASHVFPLGDALPDGDGVWVEPLACVLRAAELVPPGRVLVVGCGAVGLLWLQVLRARGHEVAAADPRSQRVALARELGASTDDDPVSSAVVTAAAGLNDALGRLEPGGTLLVFAAPEDRIAVSLDAVYRKELRLVGSRSATPPFFRRAIEELPSLSLPPVKRLPLERFAEGLDLYRRGDALKVVFHP